MQRKKKLKTKMVNKLICILSNGTQITFRQSPAKSETLFFALAVIKHKMFLSLELESFFFLFAFSKYLMVAADHHQVFS